jgi:hypothetical protein
MHCPRHQFRHLHRDIVSVCVCNWLDTDGIRAAPNSPTYSPACKHCLHTLFLLLLTTSSLTVPAYCKSQYYIKFNYFNLELFLAPASPTYSPTSPQWSPSSPAQQQSRSDSTRSHSYSTSIKTRSDETETGIDPRTTHLSWTSNLYTCPNSSLSLAYKFVIITAVDILEDLQIVLALGPYSPYTYLP